MSQNESTPFLVTDAKNLTLIFFCNLYFSTKVYLYLFGISTGINMCIKTTLNMIKTFCSTCEFIEGGINTIHDYSQVVFRQGACGKAENEKQAMNL